MIKPLHFAFNGEKHTIFFMKHGDWQWIFHRPDGFQNILAEYHVREFLEISRRTAINWRTLTHTPDSAKLYLLYIHATRRIVGIPLILQGITIDYDTLRYRDREMKANEVPEWDYLIWTLRMQAKALTRHQTKGAPHEKNPAIDPPADDYCVPATFARPIDDTATHGGVNRHRLIYAQGRRRPNSP